MKEQKTERQKCSKCGVTIEKLASFPAVSYVWKGDQVAAIHKVCGGEFTKHTTE